MPADIFCERVDDDVGAEVEGPAQKGCRNGIVDDHRDAVAMGDLGDAFDIDDIAGRVADGFEKDGPRSEEHTSELQSLMRISYAVFCLKKKKKNIHNRHTTDTHCTT